jgi:hypothetical protein
MQNTVLRENLRGMRVGEVIEEGDYAYSIDDLKLHPVKISIGQKVRLENVGYMFTPRPAPYTENVRTEEIHHA